MNTPRSTEEIEQLARKLCEDDGYVWERFHESYESALTDFRSKDYYRTIAARTPPVR